MHSLADRWRWWHIIVTRLVMWPRSLVVGCVGRRRMLLLYRVYYLLPLKVRRLQRRWRRLLHATSRLILSRLILRLVLILLVLHGGRRGLLMPRDAASMIIGRRHRHRWCSPRRRSDGRSFSRRTRERHHRSRDAGVRRNIRSTGRRRDRRPPAGEGGVGGGRRRRGGPRHRRICVHVHTGHRMLDPIGRFQRR